MTAFPTSSVWDLFIDAVEGRGGPAVDGAEPHIPGKRPDILAELLDSDVPVPAEVCAWLAGLFDAEGDGPIKLVVEGLGRRKATDEILGQLRAGNLTLEMRHRMAEMLRAKGRSLRIDCLYRRRGVRGDDGMKHWDAAEFYERLVNGHDYMVKINETDDRPSAWVMELVRHEIIEKSGKRYTFYEGNIGHKDALTITANKFGMPVKTVEEAVYSLSKGRKLHSEMASDERGSFPKGQRQKSGFIQVAGAGTCPIRVTNRKVIPRRTA